MANSAGMLKESIWRDKEFRALPRTAQATYAQLLSQKELDRAGIEPLQVSKWVKGCDELTEADLWVDLKLLVERRFIVIDEETDELFVRSYMRHSELTKYPQYVKNALRCAGLVGSELIRHELAIELRRLRNKDATAKAAEIDPGLTVPEPFPNPSGTVPEPLEHGASTVNPSGTLPERCGVGEGVGELESVGGSVGGVGEKIRNGETRPSGTRNEPPRFCPKHMPDGTTADCGACGGHRKNHDRWVEQHAAETQAAEDAQRKSAAQRQRDCPNCDEAGWVLGDDGTTANDARKCNHAKETTHA